MFSSLLVCVSLPAKCGKGFLAQTRREDLVSSLRRISSSLEWYAEKDEEEEEEGDNDNDNGGDVENSPCPESEALAAAIVSAVHEYTLHISPASRAQSVGESWIMQMLSIQRYRSPNPSRRNTPITSWKVRGILDHGMPRRLEARVEWRVMHSGLLLPQQWLRQTYSILAPVLGDSDGETVMSSAVSRSRTPDSQSGLWISRRRLGM